MSDIVNLPDGNLLDFSKPIDVASYETPKRVTESYNPNDAYVCPNGHLQYNLTDEAREDCRSRHVQLPPICYEGSPCKDCAAPIFPLENDPKELQFRVRNFMMMAARLKEQQGPLLAVNADMNELALYLRNAYSYEIMMSQPQHSGNVSKAAIYYLQRERRRPSVIAGKLWRAFLKAMGVS